MGKFSHQTNMSSTEPNSAANATAPALPFNSTQLKQLELFCSYIEKNIDLVHEPKLQFFKDFLLRMGCTEISPYKLNLPGQGSGPSSGIVSNNAPSSDPNAPKRKPLIQEMSQNQQEEENILESKQDEQLPKHYLSNMGDTFIPTKESTKEAVEMKKRAVEAFRNEEYEKSGLLFGRAIYLSGGKFHPLFMKRAECLHHMGKFMSARRDATKSIELQEKNHRAYKVRGKSNMALKQWVEALHDLEKAQQYDSKDEELKSLLKEVRQHTSENATKSVYYSTAPKSTSSGSGKKKASPNQAAAPLQKKKSSNTSSTSAVASKQSPSPSTTKEAESHAQYRLNLDKDLSKKDKKRAIEKIQKDKKLYDAFSDPKLSKMMDDIAKDPAMFFKYQKTNPEIADLFGSFMGLMAHKSKK